MQCALKAADIGHLALPNAVHNLWVLRLQDEWFAQGDLERKANMPISALMDRQKASNLSSSQVCWGCLSDTLTCHSSSHLLLPGMQVVLMHSRPEDHSFCMSVFAFGGVNS